jgi:hypothetical protein
MAQFCRPVIKATLATKEFWIGAGAAGILIWLAAKLLGWRS